MSSNNPRRWNCRCCGLLLGMVLGRRVEIRYKDARYIVEGGDIVAVCRRCAAANRHLPAAPAQLGSGS